MGHVLGFGPLWGQKGLLKDAGPPGSPSEEFDTHLYAPEAIMRFNQAGGEDYPYAKVPVETTGGGGTRNVHWRESVMVTELLTGYHDPGVPNPFSAITIASMKAIGYSEVSYEEAEEYVLPTPGRRPALGEKKGGISFGDDIRKGPIAVVTPDGVVVRYINPGGGP